MHFDNKKKDTLVVGEGPTQGLNEIEAKYSRS